MGAWHSAGSGELAAGPGTVGAVGAMGAVLPPGAEGRPCSISQLSPHQNHMKTWC